MQPAVACLGRIKDVVAVMMLTVFCAESVHASILCIFAATDVLFLLM